MGIRFKKDGEYVDNMGNLEVPPSHEQKHYHYDGGNPPSKHPVDIKEAKDIAEWRASINKEVFEPGHRAPEPTPNNNLKALLAVRAELEELKLENEVLSSKLKQIYLISNSK